ncbi:hypothetical protein ABW20_dc0104027 [Dactylellina cionopaga]|nr:hypothetical protein ABW20_dc0104027 [Dactylellina cionopaga]
MDIPSSSIRPLTPSQGILSRRSPLNRHPQVANRNQYRFKIADIGPHSGCYVCHIESGLFTCKLCSAIQYCRKAHSFLDFERHSPECSRIKFLEALIHMVDRGVEVPSQSLDTLRTILPRFWRTQHPFVGKTSFQLPRLALVATFLALDTPFSLNLAFQRIQELHLAAFPLNDHISVSDYMGEEPSVFSFTAATLFKMGKDSMCYNYLIIPRWSGKSDFISYPSYKLREVPRWRRALDDTAPLSYDIFEDLSKLPFWMVRASTKSCRTLPTILLLHRWVEDLENLERLRNLEPFLASKLNFDVLEILKEYIVESAFLRKGRRLLRDDNTVLLQELRGHRKYCIEHSSFLSPAIWNRLTQNISLERNCEFPIAEKSELEPFAETLLGIWWPLMKETAGFLDFVDNFFSREPDYAQWVKGSNLARVYSCEEDERQTLRERVKALTRRRGEVFERKLFQNHPKIVSEMMVKGWEIP